MMVIRRMIPADWEPMHQIYAYYIEHTTITFDVQIPDMEAYARKMRDICEEGIAWTCEDDGRVVGFCYAHRWKEKEAYAGTRETTVYVHPDEKGRGIGLRLMKQLITDAEAQGVHALIACITCPNTASEHLHENLGFVPVSRFREVGQKFGTWLDVADYQLLLPANAK